MLSKTKTNTLRNNVKERKTQRMKSKHVTAIN